MVLEQVFWLSFLREVTCICLVWGLLLIRGDSMTLSLILSREAETKLRSKAAAVGESLEGYAARVLESIAVSPSVDELLSPFRKQVVDSGMSEEQLDNFFEGVREKAFQERKHNS